MEFSFAFLNETCQRGLKKKICGAKCPQFFVCKPPLEKGCCHEVTEGSIPSPQAVQTSFDCRAFLARQNLPFSKGR